MITDEQRAADLAEWERWLDKAMEEPVLQGGSLDFNGNGIAGCWECGWRGPPSRFGGRSACPDGRRRLYAAKRRIVGSRRSTFCPVCSCDDAEIERELDQERQQAAGGRRVEKVSRNAPCPCGSGKKAKKCCHA